MAYYIIDRVGRIALWKASLLVVISFIAFLITALFVTLQSHDDDDETFSLTTRLVKAARMLVSGRGLLLSPASSRFEADETEYFCQALISTAKLSKVTKIILMATTVFGSSNYSSNFEGCYMNCLVLPTICRKYASIVRQADALVFHSVRSDLAPALQLLRHQRRLADPRQVWVFFSLESPDTLRNVFQTTYSSRLDGFFNWTMTYRRDSDVYVPPTRYAGYQVISDYNDVQPSSVLKINGKRHLAAVVSNCKDSYGRLQILKELQNNGVEVDIFGTCSPDHKLCPGRRGEVDASCYSQLTRDYLFYASFENSICRDYFTEKLLVALNYSLIPVVIGGANYRLEAPPNSFIDASRFGSVSELAEYILQVSEDINKYLTFFEWKQRFRLGFTSDNLPLCALCRKLHQPLSSGHSKAINLRSWWIKEGSCQKSALLHN